MNASQTVPAGACRLSSEQVKALGNVLGDIAADLHALCALLVSAIQEGPERKDSMIRAGRSLAERAGALADRAGRSCGSAGVQSADDWLHPPATVEALHVLEAPRG